MDKRTVFADGLVLARSLKVLDHGVLVAEPPNVWLMHDTDGDLRMDAKELVTDRFGRRETDPENNANTLPLGAGQPDLHLRPDDHSAAPEERRVRAAADAASAASGASPRTMRATSTATRTSRRCTSITSRPRISRATRTCCARAAATSASKTRPTGSTPCGRSARIREPTARIRPASTGRTDRWRSSPPSARRSSTGAIGCRRISTGTCSWRSPRRTSSAGSWSATTGRALQARKAVRTGRIPRLDRRALPAGLPRQRPRRHAVTSSTCIAASSSIACR